MTTPYDLEIKASEEIERAQTIMERYIDKTMAIPHLKAAIENLEEAKRLGDKIIGKK